MKKRQRLILEAIVEQTSASMEELMKKFTISKRTLYYDIDEINYACAYAGEIKKINRNYVFVGDYEKLKSILSIDEDIAYDIQQRKDVILYRMLKQEKVTIDMLSQEFQLARNTIVSTIDHIKKDLNAEGLNVIYHDNLYQIVGNEKKIREKYILLMQEDQKIICENDRQIVMFNDEQDLQLSDYSISFLSNFLEFLKLRWKQGFFITTSEPYKDAEKLDFFEGIREKWPNIGVHEQRYLTAYVSTLPNFRLVDNETIIQDYAYRLVDQFEKQSAIAIEERSIFLKNIVHHLLTSYYRIKFDFPIFNPMLEEIRMHHDSLFVLIRNVLRDKKEFPDFYRIRDEEIAYLTTYFGGYIAGHDLHNHNRVILACPNGLMVSKILEIQLNKYFPYLQIDNCMTLRDLYDYQKPYDYLISTVEIPNCEKVIVVNPLLSKTDLRKLSKAFNHTFFDQLTPSIDQLLETIHKYCRVEDEEKLIKEIELILYRKKEEIKQPMLKELLTKERILTADKVEDWKQAIAKATEPLIKDGSVKSCYVDSMIENIEDHGPYVVLADNFALPHSASYATCVNSLSMSMLLLQEPIDLLGKSVKVFLVLAPIDNTSHMRALATLSEVLYDQNNMDILMSGDKEKVFNMIQSCE
ncbi:MAG: PTS sugar transporter subunit IIA [Erysipelotrichaceae bacterium]|nr:PTS sugar transporter subunit IIA [Erysipelotrichaceae bacterium]MDY5251297.1 PTS sugar transporter subunit IIA [Erysipelotrichaceae bacterium]